MDWVCTLDVFFGQISKFQESSGGFVLWTDNFLEALESNALDI